MIKLFDYELSGNCYKVRLMLSLLGLDYELIPVNFLEEEHKLPKILELNPLGQLPILIDDDVVIRDSQVYLVRREGGEDWLPLDARQMGKVMQWLSTAANEIYHGPAKARLHFVFKQTVDIKQAYHTAGTVLQVLDKHLQKRNWLELDRPTIADIACYPYIELAPEGKMSLKSYPNVVTWTTRIKQLKGYISMTGF